MVCPQGECAGGQRTSGPYVPGGVEGGVLGKVEVDQEVTIALRRVRRGGIFILSRGELLRIGERGGI